MPNSATDFDTYLDAITEADFRIRLREFFNEKRPLRSPVTHGASEHGADLIVLVDEDTDFLRLGYTIIVQAKAGNMGTSAWRNALLQLLEAPYFPYAETELRPMQPRRIALIISGRFTAEVKRSINAFNLRHCWRIEMIDRDSGPFMRDFRNYVELLLRRTSRVGDPELTEEHYPEPETVDQIGRASCRETV